MNNLNNLAIQGNLYRDASFHDGKGYFTIASNRSYKDSNSPTGWTQVTTSVPCKISGKLADALAKRLKRGAKVTLVGSLNTYNGNQKTFVEQKNGEMKSIPDSQFIVNVSSIDIEVKSESGDYASNSDQNEDQPSF